jgi:hypothetical protein
MHKHTHVCIVNTDRTTTTTTTDTTAVYTPIYSVASYVSNLLMHNISRMVFSQQLYTAESFVYCCILQQTQVLTHTTFCGILRDATVSF